MNELQRLKETRATLLAANKEIMSRAQARPEGERDLTGEENAKVDANFAEFDKLGKKIETLERMSALERAEEQLNEVTRRSAPPRAGSVLDRAQPASVSEAVRAWMLRGHGVTHEQVLNASNAGVDVNSAAITIRFSADGVVGAYSGDPTANGGPVRRDLATTTGTSAMVQWKEFTTAYDKALQFRGRALNLVTRIRTTTGVDLPVPKVDDTANRGRWLAEGGSTTNNDPTLASVTLKAFKASSDKVPISIEALQDDQVSMNMLLPMILGERIGGLFNLAATRGAGTTEPTGIITEATASGVVIAGTNASPTYSWDNFLDLKYSVDPAYREAPAEKRGFMMSDTVFGKLRKLKDGNSRYFADPFQSGPGTIDGDPIFLNNDVLATGVNAKVAAYGDYSRYFWRDVMEVTFYRLDQVAILDGKIVFLAFARADGRLINTAAVKTLANPAS
ncbi:HK97 family phage major capsid protein OS=Amycolatopsis methanolica 239 GN=AMETH_6274 PE=4 SV=1: Phage_capsid [Gemmataceae bacterium]|nr:HK97 family phage major capsid protein OS=Amycolatopsis methanolica 239 GN=AMETH_6274 PE=4 SV=1: Phage_capsid [Gemmataceae bacterium]VTU02781.1 HK97 family phage major capsid protein OS=Amycolatopsis methanolica 239 GN=AMETH_6274 PE=4 SV=1: Phage_capsid [Gemmataceae bacterium]